MNWLLLRRMLPLLVAITGVLTAASGPAPEIALSLRGVTDDTIEQGEPLRIAVRFSAPRETTSRFRLAPTEGTWLDTIAVELVPVQPSGRVLRGQPSGATKTKDVVLDRQRIAGGVWHFAPAEMATLTPGDYVVRARIQIERGAGWTGMAEAEELTVKVVPRSTEPDRITQRILAEAHAAVRTDQPQEAARILDAQLNQTPENIRLLALRAALCARGANFGAAMATLNLAFAVLPPNTPPPSELLETQQRLQQAWLNEKPRPASFAYQPWSDAPPAVLAALAQRAAAIDPALRSRLAQVASTPLDETPPPASAPPPPPKHVPAPTVPAQSGSAPKSPVAKATPAPSADGFNGSWNTNFGLVTLSVTGTAVRGTYSRNGGEIEGILEGTTVRFNWKQTNSSGRGIFRLATDGNAFTGTFAYGATADPETARNAWNGTRAR